VIGSSPVARAQECFVCCESYGTLTPAECSGLGGAIIPDDFFSLWDCLYIWGSECAGPDINCDGAIDLLDFEAALCLDGSGTNCCGVPPVVGACCVDVPTSGDFCSLATFDTCTSYFDGIYPEVGSTCSTVLCPEVLRQALGIPAEMFVDATVTGNAQGIAIVDKFASFVPDNRFSRCAWETWEGRELKCNDDSDCDGTCTEELICTNAPVSCTTNADCDFGPCQVKDQLVVMCTAAADFVDSLAEHPPEASVNPTCDLDHPPGGFYNTVTLTIDLSVPQYITDLMFSYDVLTAEYPERIGTNFPDVFSATLLYDGVPGSSVTADGDAIVPVARHMVEGSPFDLFTPDPAGCDTDFACGYGLPDAGWIHGGIVRLGCPDPENPLNRLISIVFEIANGGDDLHTTCVVLDRMALTNFEIVDPNPDFVNPDGTLETNPDNLKQGGREVLGATADGVTKVLLREEALNVLTGEFGVVEFCLNNGSSPEDGCLRLLDGSASTCDGACTADTCPKCIDAPIYDDPKSLKGYAYAVYEAPQQFNRGGTHQTDDEQESSREVGFVANWYPAGKGDPIPIPPASSSDLPFKLVRPPVVLVHGVNDGPNTWKYAILDDDRYRVKKADYNEDKGDGTNTVRDAFVDNYPAVRDAIGDIVEDMREDDLAATQADVFGHSMGAVLARRFFQASGDYFRPGNFEAGDFHTLTSMNSPHYGSPLADLVVSLRGIGCCCFGLICPGELFTKAMKKFKFPVDGQAWVDLSECSSALTDLGATNVPAHAIKGNSTPDLTELGHAQLTRIVKIAKYFCWLAGAETGTLCEGIDRLSLDILLGTPHDGVVPNDSQGGGLAAASMTAMTDADSVHLRATKDQLYNDRILTLLNEAAAQGSIWGSFPSPGDYCGAQAAPENAGSASPFAAGGDGTELTLVASPTVVTSGATIQVEVTWTPSENVEGLIIVGDGIAEAFENVPAGSTGLVGTVQIPLTLIGDIEIQAFGGAPVDTKGNDDPSDDEYFAYDSNTFVVHVNLPPTTTLEAVELAQQTDRMRVYERQQLVVTGTFSDTDAGGNPVERDLSDPVTGTTYASTNNQVVTVDAGGLMTATGSGQAVVVANNNHNGACGDSVLITVDEGLACRPEPAESAGGSLGNRYLTFQVPAPVATCPAEEVLRLTIVSLDGFPLPSTDRLYVGAPYEAPDEDVSQPGRSFMVAPLRCTPYYGNWAETGKISVYGAEIMPNSVYYVQRASSDCPNLADEFCWSDPLGLETGKFGDVAPIFAGPGNPPQPDFSDIAALVQKFLAMPTAPVKAVAQLQPNVVYPDRSIDFRDIATCVQAFLGVPYGDVFLGPCACPSAVTCNATPCTGDMNCVGVTPNGGMCIAGYCRDACARCTQP